MAEHPVLPGRLASSDVADTDQSWPVSTSEPQYTSPYISLRIDTIVDPSGDGHSRAVVQPHGAVGVLALDDEDRLLLVQQYRHPVGKFLLEIPAGTLDVDGEAPQDAAVRELAEEADIVAAQWNSALRLLATPGYSAEGWEVFRATGLSAVPHADRTDREAEEADMVQWWLPFEQAVDAVLTGRITDAMTVAAILAEQVHRTR